MKFGKVIVAGLLVCSLAPVAANADQSERARMDKCFAGAAQKYNVPIEMLWAIAKVESNFNQRATNLANANGTGDYGIMQINSSWFPVLEKNYGIRREKVKADVCTNIYVGAWVLAHNVFKRGFVWDSVGAYNAGFATASRAARLKYVEKVKRHYFQYLAYTKKAKAQRAVAGL